MGCQDKDVSFTLPDGKRTNCVKAKRNQNTICNTRIVQENCPRLCKVCPLCNDSVDKVFMGNEYGMKTCSFAQSNHNVCNIYSWLKKDCPLSCESCCKDQSGEIPLKENIGDSITCEFFKLAKNKKYCTWSRIKKSCPESCDLCSTPAPVESMIPDVNASSIPSLDPSSISNTISSSPTGAGRSLIPSSAPNIMPNLISNAPSSFLKCQDKDVSFTLPDGKRTNCVKAKRNRNTIC